MPLPRYSLDDGADGDEETFEESYVSNAASTSRLPAASAAGGSRSFSQTPSVSGRRSTSPSLSAYDAPASLDIDALLGPTASSSTKPALRSKASSGWPYSSRSPVARMSPFEQLTHFMSSQKASPELLPFPTSSFDALISQMEQQQSILDSLLHLQPSFDDEGEGEGVDEDEYLRLTLVQVDLERCKWLLKQVVRCRMDLLQKYAGFVAGRSGERDKLNASEATFVREFWQLKKDHLHTSVLGFLPEQLHDLSQGQQEEGLSQQDAQHQNNSSNMVPGPDLDAPVFIRCLEDCGPITLPDGEEATLSIDSVHLLRYRSIRHLVYQGFVVLL
ncbi:GINS complex, subunit Sld5 [Kalmanozyma brasiliensis GHG001]|uniref:DNA replication complex GINS protein SLD5 C-terminal domain-containing protein n=1 Tax=Kalmanozyma brasiliensis (strain GHG001) TaxID=1365824 RepID=V5E4T0_KALBG|nr:GINS complex, subunit Sld5 [Kalmanozyma brasiliensis GHG001]EST05216.1 GINS complex, subunit Sld5 [Kalmanozyma brasiliensis GHG001]